MIPQPITLHGKTGTIVYMNALWHPVTPEQATMAKVVFDDGSVSFYTAQASVQKREYVREPAGSPKGGEFAKQLQGDEEDARTFTHGTTAIRLEEILSQGLLTGHAGEIWPTFSDRNSVYMSASEDDAIRWAINAADKDVRTGAQGARPPIAIITIRVPEEYASRVIKDRHFADEGDNPARQFEGNISPKWIIGAKVGKRSTASMWDEYQWTEVPLKKAAQDGQLLYIAVVLHSVAKSEKPEGLGGITRKFDAALHPRGEDGRFIEATAPRIFNRPEEIGTSTSGWPGDPIRYAWIDKETGKPGGHLLTGEPLTREQLPEILYHVTTNVPAVEASGVLLGLLGDGGLGGGQAPGVSMTSSREDATVIQRELRRAVLIARGAQNEKAFNVYARQDEEEARLPVGSLQYTADQAMESWEGNKFSLERTYVQGQGYINEPPAPEERERLRRSLMKDAFNSYLWARETAAEKANAGQKVPLLKNPILFGRQEQLAKLKPEDVGILEIPSAQIPEGALITTGSDKFLHEVRTYSDVPLRKKKAAREYVREPAGSPKGGEFAQTRQGVRAELMDVIGDGPVGVDDHPVAIRAAHDTAAVLREMKAKGYPMPREVDVSTQHHLSGEASRGTLMVKVPDNLPPDVTLDEAYAVTFGGKTGVLVDGPLPEGVVSHGPVGTQQIVEIARFSGTKFRDLVIHEMGHILRHDMDYAENHTAASAFAEEMKAIKLFEKAALTTVSKYAATNPDEFVAEVFTKLYNGESVPVETRRIYDDLRGASVL